MRDPACLRACLPGPIGQRQTAILVVVILMVFLVALLPAVSPLAAALGAAASAGWIAVEFPQLLARPTRPRCKPGN